MSYPDQERISKVLEKMNKGKIKATQVISPEASPIDRMKFNICQQIIKFKRENNYSNIAIAAIIDVGPAVVSRILHCQISKFKIDALLGYYFALVISTKDKKLIKKFHQSLSDFMKDAA